MNEGNCRVSGAVFEPRSYSLDSGEMRTVFQADENGLRLCSLSDRDGREWIGETGDGNILWKLSLVTPDERTVDVNSSEAVLTECTADSDRLRFSWQLSVDGKALDVRVAVRCEKGSALSYWSLECDLPDNYKLLRLDFPIIPNIKLHEDLKMAVPSGWGLEHDVKPGISYEGTYPSWQAAMQFLAFYYEGKGLYIGMHDPAANHKHFTVKTGEDTAGFSCANWLGLPKQGGGTARLLYEAVIGVFNGDYCDATQIYRNFTFDTPWGNSGPVSKRPIPDWLKNTDLWIRPDGSPEANVELTRQALEYFDVPTSLHWYRWHVIPYDTLYPEYFPPLPGFAEGIKELQDAGSHVVPYINGRLCDPNSITWNDENGYRSAARQQNGDPYTEIYGSKVPLNVMCPYTLQWQEKVAYLVDRLIQECGANGVYIDQIACAEAKLCFNEDHGHLPGGGSFWVDGYRTLLEKVRSKLPEGHIITTEENAECWIDQFDALLLVNTPASEQKIIPLFPAVYSGRVVTYGFLYYAPDDIQKSIPFRMKTAQALIFGSQLGWIQPWRIMAPEATKEAEYLRNLARCRHYAHDFLTYGRFIGLLDVEGDNPRVSCQASKPFGGTYTIDIPSVTASAWLAEDGRLGVVLANISDDKQDVHVSLPLDKAGMRPEAGIEMEVYGSEGLIRSSKSHSEDCWLEVPGGRALVLWVTQNKMAG